MNEPPHDKLRAGVLAFDESHLGGSLLLGQSVGHSPILARPAPAGFGEDRSTCEHVRSHTSPDYTEQGNPHLSHWNR